VGVQVTGLIPWGIMMKPVELTEAVSNLKRMKFTKG